MPASDREEFYWACLIFSVTVTKLLDSNVQLVHSEELHLHNAVLQKESGLVGKSTFQDDMHDILRTHGGEIKERGLIENTFAIYPCLRE